jgi:hypothetical protein
VSLAFQRFFIPAVKVIVPLFTGTPIAISNLDGSGLRIEWDLARDNTSTPDEGEVRIYNLSPTLRGTIYESWKVLQTRQVSGVGSGMELDLSIGFDKIAKRVFLGDVWDFVPEERTPTDVISIFRLGDGNRAQRDQATSRAFVAVSIADVLDYFIRLPPSAPDAGGGGLGLIYPPEARALIKAEAAKLPKALQSWPNVPDGLNTRELIDLVMETLGLEWRVHNGEFIAMRGGIINRPGSGIDLRPGTGLISYTPRNDGGVSLTALAVPEAEPGIQVVVTNDLGKPFAEPFYRVERVSFNGSTDGDSLMSMDAAKGRPL